MKKFALLLLVIILLCCGCNNRSFTSTEPHSVATGSATSTGVSSVSSTQTDYDEYGYDRAVELPIALFAPQMSHLIDQSAYFEMVEAGANVLLGTEVGRELEMLDLAQNAGMKLMLYNADLIDADGESAIRYIKKYQSHPAYLGVVIIDEPSTETIKYMAEMVSELTDAFPDKYVYINLVPTYSGAFSNTQEYVDYVDLLLKECHVNLLSYDNYGVMNNGIRDDFYLNAEIFIQRGKEKNIPVWTFALCTQHFGYPKVTIENMRWQVSNELAMGSRGIQWFTYGTPSEEFHDAPLDVFGKRTATYNILKQVNNEIKLYDHILMALKHQVTLFHMDEKPYLLNQDTEWKDIASIEGDDAVIGCFEDDSGNTALYVANYSYTKEASLTINLESGCATSCRIWNDIEGATVAITDNSVAIHLKAGEGKLIQLFQN